MALLMPWKGVWAGWGFSIDGQGMVSSRSVSRAKHPPPPPPQWGVTNENWHLPRGMMSYSDRCLLTRLCAQLGFGAPLPSNLSPWPTGALGMMCFETSHSDSQVQGERNQISTPPRLTRYRSGLGVWVLGWRQQERFGCLSPS